MLEQSTLEQFRKIAIVTGGSRGIGRNTVASLAKHKRSHLHSSTRINHIK